MTTAGSATAIRNLGARAWRRVRAAHKPLVRRARRRARQAERREVLREVAAIERELGRIAAGRGPIIAGPWLGEVGYEALYWVPFLRWVQDAFRIRRERFVVVSRGGPRAWYEDFTGSYVEMFDLVGPGELASGNELRRHREEGGGRKQTAPGDLDARILALARRHAGLEAGRVCHPSLMFRLFRHVWHGALPYDDLWTRTRYVHPPVTPPVLDGLPAEYTAARFYTGVALPPVAWVRDRIRGLVAREAGARPVVVLDPEVGVDEHEDYALLDIPNVVSARRWMRPATNLGVQTAPTGFSVPAAGSHGWLPFSERQRLRRLRTIACWGRISTSSGRRRARRAQQNSLRSMCVPNTALGTRASTVSAVRDIDIATEARYAWWLALAYGDEITSWRGRMRLADEPQ